ncbi:hypothetical protein CISG_01006 [Coccidioides immitis RMSCC 3703]|uniref:HAUS augmin-like complex subunit 1 n=1 Tax=Coccidioides immitis RMSCC 3703 TaxID=454286 RepID=A0A0J8QUW1_COCIT|nr:hypothetical protein CISG_01006 [Coccidioides immitis RMSCC 3703]
MEEFETISSPSKARQAASQAKDWAYVMNWLNHKYANSPNRVPNFERNEDTLKVLLNLAAANDTADEEEALIHRVREETIGLLKAEEIESPNLKLDLLEDIQAALSDESSNLLQDLAETVVLLATKTGRRQKYLEKELATLHMRLEELKDEHNYETPPDLPAKTSEWLRGKRTVEAKAKEYQRRITAGRSASDREGTKIEDLMAEEERVVKISENVKRLQKKVETFHGLPSNILDAKLEYQKLESELRSLIQQRDNLFEGLVDRGKSQ